MSSKDLTASVAPLVTAEVVRLGDKITVPEGMTLKQAAQQIQAVMEFEEEKVSFSRNFNVMPFDGAYALQSVISNIYGWTSPVPTPGFFGPNPPQIIQVANGVNSTVGVIWGRIALPNIVGFLETDAAFVDGRWIFQVDVVTKQKNRLDVERLLDAVNEYLKTNSLYAGKAIKLSFRDSSGKPIKDLQPEFMDLSKVSRDMLIYSQDVQDAIDVELFTPIERMTDCIANNIPVKRGVLLGGPYGTGKTLAATVAAKLAVDHGITYVYVPHCGELADAIQFAKQYSKTACVIFCEDIDRAVTGERSVAIDDIVNMLDGIDTKAYNIITVLTTNHLENINPTILRPGRIDSIIPVNPPDAEAVERLIRFYGKGSVEQSEDLTKVGELLAGNTPAVIAEAVKRAKLAQLSLQPEGTKVTGITAEALCKAASSMQYQLQIMRELVDKQKPTGPTLEGMLGDLIYGKVAQFYNED